MSTGLLSNENKQFIVQHEVGGVAGVVGYPTKLWYATKKYSINGTISTAALNTWVQFSLAYITAIMITHNDLSFLTNILDPSAISLYALVSLVLVAAFLTSVTLKYIHKQEIKDEDFIDEEIRGGQSDRINHLAQDARAIEIFPDVSHITDKKISIIIPIAEKQGTALENQAAENRNKVIFITAPYVISSLIVTIALGKFGFANIRGWEEISFISMVVAIAVVGALVALSKLKDNKIKQMSNTTVKFGSPNIIPFFNTFAPFSKSKIALVMENKVESSEDNDIVSRVLKLVDKRLTDFIGVIDSSVFKPLSAKAQKTLDGVRADIRTLFHTLEANITKDVGEVKTTANEAITACLQGIANSVDELCNGVEKGVQDKLGEVNVKKVMDLVDILQGTLNEIKNKANEINAEEIMSLVTHLSRMLQTAEDRLARLQPGPWAGMAGATFSSERMPNIPVDDKISERNEFMGILQQSKKRKDELEAKIQTLEAEIRTLKGKGPESGYSSPTDSEDGDNAIADPLKTRGIALRKEVKILESQKEVRDLEKKKKELEEELEKEAEREKEAKLEKEVDALELKQRERNLEKRKKELEEEGEKEDKEDNIRALKKKLNGKPKEFLDYMLKSIVPTIDGKKVLLQDYDNKILIHWKNGSQTIFYINKQEELQGKGVKPGTKMDGYLQAVYAAAGYDGRK